MAKKDEIEMESLNLLTTAFIDTVEDRARRHLIMKMADWKGSWNVIWIFKSATCGPLKMAGAIELETYKR